MFNRGDKVKWSSQSMGNHVKKAGVIVAVIPPIVKPDITQYVSDHSVQFTNPGYRDKESYLISVAPKEGSKARPKLYWPVASLLKKA